MSAFARVPDLLAQHVQLSFAALLLALCIALPLAVIAARVAWVARVALTFASLVQTIPALALLALFYPLLLALSNLLGGGISPLGFLPSLLALSFYALLPILRNSVTGLKGLDPAIVEAADGVGMTGLQKLWLVEAPLAAPSIMGGVRTAAVWTIGAATLSTTVGQPSLGDLIFAGLQTQNWALVLTGCVASALLAISVDSLLGIVENAIATRRWRRVVVAALVLASGLALALVPSLQTDNRETITIGAKRFTEQYILAALIGQKLEAAGYRVAYREGLGSAVIFSALANDDIDIYVDYAGTIWTNEMQRSDNPPRDAMREAIAAWALAQKGVTLAGPLGFENSYAFAVRGKDAKAMGLKSLDDLARVSPTLRFGTDLEFLERPEWQLVKTAYPLRFARERALEPSFMYRALADGQVDVISAFSSDGRIAANGFVILDDPKGAIPNYDAILLIAPNRAKDAGLRRAVEPLVDSINVENMRSANNLADRDVDKLSPELAAKWLSEHLIRKGVQGK